MPARRSVGDASALVSLDEGLRTEVLAAVASFHPITFALRRYSENLSVVWADGPPAPAVLSTLSPLVPRLAEEAPDLHFVCERRYSHRSLCMALEFVLSQGGFPPELEAAGRAARAAADARREDPYLALFHRTEWADADLTGFAASMATRMLSALGLVDLTDADGDVLRPGAPGVAALVETLDALSADAGVTRPQDLVLWAAAQGYAVSEELASSRSAPSARQV